MRTASAALIACGLGAVTCTACAHDEGPEPTRVRAAEAAVVKPPPEPAAARDPAEEDYARRPSPERSSLVVGTVVMSPRPGAAPAHSARALGSLMTTPDGVVLLLDVDAAPGRYDVLLRDRPALCAELFEGVPDPRPGGDLVPFGVDPRGLDPGPLLRRVGTLAVQRAGPARFEGVITTPEADLDVYDLEGQAVLLVRAGDVSGGPRGAPPQRVEPVACGVVLLENRVLEEAPV